MSAVEDIKETQGPLRRFAAAGGVAAACCAAEPPAAVGAAVEHGLLYSDEEMAAVPDTARKLSRGCGNPLALAGLRSGEAVADFGCGGGIDVVLAARQVGPAGRVTGVDMTPEMIERARQSVTEAGLAARVDLVATDIAPHRTTGCLPRRGDLELRDQPGRGEGRRLPRDIPHPAPRRTPRDLRHHTQ